MEDPIIQICKSAFLFLTTAAMTNVAAQAKRDDNGHSALNRYVEARLAETSNDPATAIAIYTDTLKRQPDNALVASKAYVKALETGNFPLALNAVRTLELNGTIDAEMPLLLFADAFARRDWKSANTALLQLESLNNFAFLTPILGSWLDVAKGDFDAVNIAKIRTSSTGKFYYEEQRLLHLLASGNEETAAPLIARIVKSNDVRMSPIRMLTARHFLARKQDAKALDVLQMQRTGPEAKLIELIGNGKAKGQKIDAKAGGAFVLQRLSADLGAQNAEFLALVTAQVAQKINPRNDFSHLLLGRAYQLTKNSNLARRQYDDVSPESPYYLIALNAEISSFIQDKEYQAAQKRLDAGIARDSGIPELFILKGQLLQAKEDQPGAADAYKEAIRLGELADYSKPLLANYYLALGSAQEQGGQWPAGLRSLEKANELFPNSASILNYLGYAQLERRENTENAIEAIRKAFNLRSTSPAITDSLGWAYFLTGEHEKAVDYLEKALNGQPDDPTINEHLGDVYWTVGRKFEARYAWKSAKLFADSEDITRLATKIDKGLSPETVSP